MYTMNILQWLGYTACGSLIAFAILNMSDDLILWLGTKVTPNVISIMHTPIALFGYFAFYEQDFVLLGIIIVVFGAILDKLDGKMGRIFDAEIAKQLLPKSAIDSANKNGDLDTVLQAFIAEKCSKKECCHVIIAGKLIHISPVKNVWQAIWYPGQSEFGKVIDPAMDKLAISPIYIWIAYSWAKNPIPDPMSYLYFFGSVIIALILFADLCGTLIRLDFFKRKGWIKRKSATRAGKIKSLSQWLWLLLYMVDDHGMLPAYKIEFMGILDFLLVGILVLAVISVASKMIFTNRN